MRGCPASGSLHFPPAPPLRIHSAVPTRPPTVLLAEDDEATRLFFAQVLTRDGYLVVSAPTGRDAIAACRDRTERKKSRRPL